MAEEYCLRKTEPNFMGYHLVNDYKMVKFLSFIVFRLTFIMLNWDLKVNAILIRFEDALSVLQTRLPCVNTQLQNLGDLQ